jgi:predicted transcriptional regulator
MSEAPQNAAELQRKREAIARGRADAAAGRVVGHEDVQRWVESWGDDAPLARGFIYRQICKLAP